MILIWWINEFVVIKLALVMFLFIACLIKLLSDQNLCILSKFLIKFLSLIKFLRKSKCLGRVVETVLSEAQYNSFSPKTLPTEKKHTWKIFKKMNQTQAIARNL